MGPARAALCALLIGGAAVAQPVPFAVPGAAPPAFLILDQDRLLTGSAFGQSLLAQNEAETDDLRREGQALDRQFEAEERALTEQRAELLPEAFRDLADAFDEKVVRTRREQEEKANALADRIDRRRRAFFRQVGPVLLGILEESGAVAIVEQRSVLIAKQDLNITDEAIKRIDAAFRAGEISAPEVAPAQDQGPDEEE